MMGALLPALPGHLHPLPGFHPQVSIPACTGCAALRGKEIALGIRPCPEQLHKANSEAFPMPQSAGQGRRGGCSFWQRRALGSVPLLRRSSAHGHGQALATRQGVNPHQDRV